LEYENHNSVYGLPEETPAEIYAKLEAFRRTLSGIAGHNRAYRHKQQIERLERKVSAMGTFQPPYSGQ